jgi:nucleotide-binding universal stress UspA family protein
MTKAIVSYDGTPTDHDALELGRLLADTGVELILAYVRHTTENELEREVLEERDARNLLARGAHWLEDPDVEQRVIISGSTAGGLVRLADQVEADIVVFGSDYRTAAGHVAPQSSARSLLECGPTAVAIAPANYRYDSQRELHRVGLLAPAGDDAALETARDLAESLGAQVTRDEPFVDLLVVGSRPEAPAGRLMLSSHSHKQVESATSPVIVLPHGVSLRFPAIVGIG